MTESNHAWFSQKQFDNVNKYNKSNNRHMFPYVYYKLKSGTIVQITEVTPEKKHYFDDVQYLGEIDSYYTCAKIMQKFI